MNVHCQTSANTVPPKPSQLEAINEQMEGVVKQLNAIRDYACGSADRLLGCVPQPAGDSATEPSPVSAVGKLERTARKLSQAADEINRQLDRLRSL